MFFQKSFDNFSKTYCYRSLSSITEHFQMFTLIRFYFGLGLTRWEVLVSFITYCRRDCFQFVHFVKEPQNFIAVQRESPSSGYCSVSSQDNYLINSEKRGPFGMNKISCRSEKSVDCFFKQMQYTFVTPPL